MRKVGLILGVGILLATSWYFYTYKKEDLRVIKMAETELTVEVANNPLEWQRGLSGRPSLGADRGMLFAFDKPDRYGFWMKEMNFPLDIAWIDRNQKIIYMLSNVAPSSYPEIFYPDGEALFVLETNSGFFAKNKIEVGQTLEMNDF